MRTSWRLNVLVCALLASWHAPERGRAQVIAPGSHVSGHLAAASNVVIPQARAYAVRDSGGPIVITAVTADVVIVEQVATTTLDVALSNPGARQQEAELLVPVPDGAVVRAFAFEGPAAEPTARLLVRTEAKAVYDSIVRKLRDPALLEFAGYSLVRSSVFPVPARGTQKVRLTYEHILSADGNRIDYALPRSELLQSAAVPWTISATVKSKRPISTVYSPSHSIVTQRLGPGHVSIRTADALRAEPGPFQLSYLLEGEGVTASLLAYPDSKNDGGYFLLLGGMPAAAPPKDARAIRREVILVIDRSGSMQGEKIEQARAAALQVLDGLSEREAFNIIDYADTIASFSPSPVTRTAEQLTVARQYVRQLRSGGGTNLHDAVIEALRVKPTASMLPIVLLLTDGQPTVGNTSEAAIRADAVKANVHERRIFTFGVGYDVNVPLLDALARSTRGSSTCVLPKENVEAKVSEAFRRLSGPVVAGPRLEALDEHGNVTTTAVRELMPATLSDLFESDQLIVLGQYRGTGPLRFRLTGNCHGTARTFAFRFDLAQATVRNAFVPRLWASRKIASLIDEIRQAGADARPAAGWGKPHPSADPRRKEVTDEIVRLSTEFGILTEYTAFLAEQGTDLSRRDAVLAQAGQSLRDRAVDTRAGIGAVNQGVNIRSQVGQSNLNPSNTFYDRNMNRVEITNVQQISDRAFFRRGDRWVDSRVLDRVSTLKVDEQIEFGTPAYDRLVERLVARGEQGLLALTGDTVFVVDGRAVLVRH
jgi:Ca-activated chloride channel family protein